MQCPRCRTEIGVLPDPGGSVVCPGCGARLMTRNTATRSGGSGATPIPGASNPGAPRSNPDSSNPALLAHHPSETLAPWATPRKTAQPGEDTARTQRQAPPAREGGAPAAGTASRSADPGAVSLDQILDELRAVRETQEQILTLLRSGGGEVRKAGGEESLGAGIADPAPVAPVRTRRRKTVLLIDDDPATRDAAVAQLDQAQVPVRAVADGNAGIQAIAAEKPDVIAIELDIAGNMAGKDVINMIKATMEWVDIPILLYTRVPLESQKEARNVHGADDLVLKESGPAALVSRVITFFRRGS